MTTANPTPETRSFWFEWNVDAEATATHAAETSGEYESNYWQCLLYLRDSETTRPDILVDYCAAIEFDLDSGPRHDPIAREVEFTLRLKHGLLLSAFIGGFTDQELSDCFPEIQGFNEIAN